MPFANKADPREQSLLQEVLIVAKCHFLKGIPSRKHSHDSGYRGKNNYLDDREIHQHRKAVTSTTTTIATEDEFVNYNDTIDAL
ncbi:16098_t:CDS:2 [Entrophospora sp. SA101]|nr:16098_t:CDS:2 [Entrophospora sp. SA101]